MSNIDENLKIQKITRLLEKGGTMLASSHECGAPMFRFQGKVMCPVCDSEAEDEKKAAEVPDNLRKQVKIQKESIPAVSRAQGDYGQIVESIRKQVQSITDNLENETDLHRIREKLECIEIGIRILKLLEREGA